MAITTYSFDIDGKIIELVGDALSESEKIEFKDALRQQTCSLLTDNSKGGISKALVKVEELAKKQNISHQLPTTHNITTLFEIVDDCIRLGTVPFSILARHGFIARTILLSLNSCDILSTEDINSIQSGVRTVASNLVDDMHRLQRGELSRSDFMSEYGHLRPGTYDILSRRYDDMPDLGIYDSQLNPEQTHQEFVLSNSKKSRIDQFLRMKAFLNLMLKN